MILVSVQQNEQKNLNSLPVQLVVMNATIHRIAAKTHFDIAETSHQQYNAEQGADKKIALRTVAAQNYFYAAINAIECIFAEKVEQHSFNHENRLRKLVENSSFFSRDAILLYEQVDRDIRNKVAYRGENGKKYEAVKKLATLLCGAI